MNEHQKFLLGLQTWALKKNSILVNRIKHPQMCVSKKRKICLSRAYFCITPPFPRQDEVFSSRLSEKEKEKFVSKT